MCNLDKIYRGHFVDWCTCNFPNQHYHQRINDSSERFSGNKSFDIMDGASGNIGFLLLRNMGLFGLCYRPSLSADISLSIMSTHLSKTSKVSISRTENIKAMTQRTRTFRNLFVIFCTWLALKFIYCWHKSIVANIPHYTRHCTQ
jgi:hypothetical protein